MTPDPAFVVPEPVVFVAVAALVVRSVWHAVRETVAEIDRRGKVKARIRKARVARRLQRKADRWYAATSVLQFARGRDAGSVRFAQERADDLHDRGREARRARLDGWVPRVVLPAAPPRQRRRRW